MPPKKKNVEEEKQVLIGRMGTNLKCGIVGLPNVGKSTFFNVLTKTSMAAAENFPFCTIDPNENKYRDNGFGIILRVTDGAQQLSECRDLTVLSGIGILESLLPPSFIVWVALKLRQELHLVGYCLLEI